MDGLHQRNGDLFGVDVVVEAPLQDAELVGDVLHRRGGVATLVEHLLGGLEHVVVAPQGVEARIAAPVVSRQRTGGTGADSARSAAVATRFRSRVAERSTLGARRRAGLAVVRLVDDDRRALRVVHDGVADLPISADLTSLSPRGASESTIAAASCWSAASVIAAHTAPADSSTSGCGQPRASAASVTPSAR